GVSCVWNRIKPAAVVPEPLQGGHGISARARCKSDWTTIENRHALWLVRNRNWRLHECFRRDGHVRQPRGFDKNVIDIKLGRAAETARSYSRKTGPRAACRDVVIDGLPRRRLGLAAIGEPDFSEYIVHAAL